MRLIKQGAEARLFLSEYLGEACVVKQRERKKYREKILDSRILSERIRAECALLAKARKAGVRTPLVREVNLKDFTFTQEFIRGETLREELLKEGKNCAQLCIDAGESIGMLHGNDLVHGDLTTSNIILHNGVLVFLDFGLGSNSAKIEGKAVDLLVFKKTFSATHYGIIGLWKSVEKGYCRGYSKGKEVLKHLAKVEARARYY